MNWNVVGSIQSEETIAEGNGIRELKRLLDVYGGKNWRKKKGMADDSLSTQRPNRACGGTLVRSPRHR